MERQAMRNSHNVQEQNNYDQRERKRKRSLFFVNLGFGIAFVIAAIVSIVLIKAMAHGQEPIVLPPLQAIGETSEAPKAEAKDIAEDLVTLGWITEEQAEKATEEEFHAVCHEYCEFFGLEHGAHDRLKGVADHIHSRHCMVPDNLGMEEANWPTTCRQDLGLYWDWAGFRASTVGFSEQEAKDIVDEALNHWNSKVGLRLYRSTDFPSAVCSVKWVGLGGSTLAWSNFPDNSCEDDKRQRYDANRRWSKHQLYQTIIHECGHLVGLPHRRGNFVMNPTIITSLNGLTDRDVRDAMALGYGDPFDLPPTPTTPTGYTGSITLTDGSLIPASRIREINLTFSQVITIRPTTPTGTVIVLPPL
jgi:hypothetical protein